LTDTYRRKRAISDTFNVDWKAEYTALSSTEKAEKETKTNNAACAMIIVSWNIFK